MFGPNNVILITHTRDIYLTWDLIILHSNMYTQHKTFYQATRGFSSPMSLGYARIKYIKS